MIKLAFLTALVCATGQALSAGPRHLGECGATRIAGRLVAPERCPSHLQNPPPASDMILPRHLSHGPGDIVNGRGPNAYARELQQIAFSLSIGDWNAVTIASSRLRKFGVTKDRLRDAMDRINVHTPGPMGNGFYGGHSPRWRDKAPGRTRRSRDGLD